MKRSALLLLLLVLGCALVVSFAQTKDDDLFDPFGEDDDDFGDGLGGGYDDEYAYDGYGYEDDYKYDDEYKDEYMDQWEIEGPGNKTLTIPTSAGVAARGRPRGGAISDTVSGAPAAELINGIDDIKPDGNCTAEIKQYCDGVAPGEARLADCLQEQVEAEETDSANAAKGTISKRCKTELLDFKVLRDTNINLNTKLAKACKIDADSLCNITWFFGYKSGQVVACLRDRKDKLTGPCKKEVFKIQLDAALDYRADVNLFEACQPDASALCADVEAGGGRIQACLRDNRMKLRGQCEEELFRQEMEDADDIRLSVRLFRKCLPDKKKFCADVPPGNAAAKECLEEHREEEDFSAACREELESMIARRVRDFRLDTRLQKVCEKDIYNICALWPDMEAEQGEINIVNCLQDYVKEIQNPACKKRVRRYKRLAAQDIRFNVPLADNCFEDRQKFCASVPPGNARVIRCLESNREMLSQNCRAALFDEQQKFGENIDFQFPMKKACTKEMGQFCKDVPKGRGRVIRCLQQHKNEKEFGAECKKEVVRYEQAASGDYRLNFRLKEACKDDVKNLCKDVCKLVEGQICAGQVLRCLTEKKEELQNKECMKEVTYFQKMEVSDWRNDVILAEACRKDVESHCADVEPGEGRVHACLRKNRAKLSAACKKEEQLLEQQEAESIELRVNLLKSCSKERTAYCGEVEAGGGRVFRCLAENLGDADFGDLCREEVRNKLRRRQSNWRLDPALRKACRKDVSEVCNGEDRRDVEDGAVYKCLIAHVEGISVPCQRELSRAVHMAFFTWEPEGILTTPCDTNINDFCLKDRPNMAATPGAVSQCLGTILQDNYAYLHDVPAKPTRKAPASGYVVVAELDDTCRQLIEVAQPQDMRKMFETSLVAAVLANQLQTIEGYTGVQMLHRDTNGNAQSLTLSGWTAILGIVALMIVVVYGAVAGYRRYYGLDKDGYTLVVKTKKGAGGE